MARGKGKRQPRKGKRHKAKGTRDKANGKKKGTRIRTKRKKRRTRMNAKDKCKGERQKEKKEKKSCLVLPCLVKTKTHHFVLVDKSHAQLTQNKDSLLGLGQRSGQGL